MATPGAGMQMLNVLSAAAFVAKGGCLAKIVLSGSHDKVWMVTLELFV